MRISVRIEGPVINRSIEDVFKFISEMENSPRWGRAAKTAKESDGPVSVGTVFLDCSAGNKHAPAFADVLIRRPYTLSPVDVGETGIIEVISTLPTSYPGQALITEDQGTLVGVDDCPCGRQGRYFRFTSRIERVELRGCGDTFAQSRGI